jgi:hypothetical protein
MSLERLFAAKTEAVKKGRRRKAQELYNTNET